MKAYRVCHADAGSISPSVARCFLRQHDKKIQTYKMKKEFTCLLLIMFFISTKTFSQSRLGVMLGGGVNYYYGEMNDRVMTDPNLLRGYGNIGLLYRISPHFEAWLNYMHGTLAGDDQYAIAYEARNRNLNFNSTLDEVALMIGFKPLGESRGNKRHIIPYLFAGVGGFHFNPKTTLNGETIALHDIGTEGQYISSDGDNYPKPYSLYALSFPAGIGVEIKLSRAFALRVEAANHFTLTDYLDDVSNAYPDSTALASTPNGAVAVLLSNRQKEGDFPEKGMKRGNPGSRDSYMHIGVSILFTPVNSNSSAPSTGKKKKKSHCPAYH